MDQPARYQVDALHAQFQGAGKRMLPAGSDTGGVPAQRGELGECLVQVGLEDAKPAPGVVDAILGADAVLIAPSNPVVSIGTILGLPEIRDAVRTTAAPVVGVSPIIGGAPVRGMADACLAAIGVPATAQAVAAHYGPGLLDGWLVDEQDKAAVDAPELAGITVRALPLYMTSLAATTTIARAALDLAQDLRG
jgi:LPPG:FO 2-phospho-L-lactate transferase